ncbi:unnamed protein product [Cunninghamella blakesleeana]
MATTYSFTLPKFSGSTLEPTVEPLAFLPPVLKTPPITNHPLPVSEDEFEETSSIASSTTSLTNDDNHHSSFSLKRANRPTFIDIPEACKTFSLKDYKPFDDWSSYDPQDRRLCQSAEFLWDENTQSVYKQSECPHPNPEKHIFWSA